LKLENRRKHLLNPPIQTARPDELGNGRAAAGRGMFDLYRRSHSPRILKSFSHKLTR
jgi:hypothetical protein